MLTRFGSQLGDEQCLGVALDKESVALLLDIAPAQTQYLAIHQLDGSGTVTQSRQIGFKAGLKRPAVSAQHHDLAGRQGVERHSDLGDKRQGALTAGEQLAQVDGALRQWLGSVVQVGNDLVDGIATTASTQLLVRETVIDESDRFVVQSHRQELRIDAFNQARGLTLAPELHTEPPLQLGHSKGFECLDRAVAEHSHSLQHMMPRAAVDQRMGAARVVTHHATDAASIAGRCLGAEEQSIGLERTVQLVAHHTWLDPGPTLLSVYLKDVAPVSTDIGHDARTHHLSGQRGASRTRNDVGVT